MQATMQKKPKRRAPRSEYTSPSQLSLPGSKIPFYNHLDPSNRWVQLSVRIPWDDLVSLFNRHNPPKWTGRSALNPRVLIGAVIIKHILNLDDRETVAQISENMYLQYSLGYSSHIRTAPFDASLFVDIRKRLGQEPIGEMNERIHAFSMEMAAKKAEGKTGMALPEGKPDRGGRSSMTRRSVPRISPIPPTTGCSTKPARSPKSS